MKPLLLLLILQHRKSPNIPRLFMLLQKKKNYMLARYEYIK